DDRFGDWRIHAQNRFLSDAFLLFRDQLSFRDENHLLVAAERPLSSVTSLRITGQSGIFSQSRVYSQNLYAGLRYHTAYHAWVEARAGASMESRPGADRGNGIAPLRNDAGPAYGAAFSFAPPPIDGYHLRLMGEGTWQVMAPRRGRMVRLQSAAERTFEQT